MKKILIIQGHPDSDRSRFGYQLSKAYEESALQAGHEVKQIMVADLVFPLLRSKQDFETKLPPPAILEQQRLISWANHLVIFYPLWLGGMPALLKGFLEQCLRPDFAYANAEGQVPKPLLNGKSARIVVTMGMPAFAYRWYFRAHSLRSLQRNILYFCGIRPVKTSLIGMVEGVSPKKRTGWLDQMHGLGNKAL